ncbi:putative pentatricopeptide repeat-containing protein At3g11460, mitochondrial [Curcuma longa]|uniref:putative pentatricopeptide repeat-containing protein At3g11460, mitochondrial n=1 Tax=Curcuma longa TaxID=136217 RepID=UPI003D9DEF22
MSPPAIIRHRTLVVVVPLLLTWRRHLLPTTLSPSAQHRCNPAAAVHHPSSFRSLSISHHSLSDESILTMGCTPPETSGSLVTGRPSPTFSCNLGSSANSILCEEFKSVRTLIIDPIIRRGSDFDVRHTRWILLCLPHLALLRHTLLWYPQLPIPIASLLPSALLAAAALSLPAAAFHLHAISLKSGLLPADAYVLTTVVTAYSRLRLLPLACRLLDELPAAEVATSAFNALISGHALASSPSPSPAALATFRRMRLADVPFDDVTFLALLPAAPPASIPPLHGVAFRSSLASAPSVSNCLLSCFSRIGAVDVARQLFDEMPDQRKDLVSWNAMISCYAQNGLAHQVLALYDKMKESPSVEPDAITLIGVLSSCANLGAYSIGRRIENSINQKDSYASNTHIKNALINLHAKCGDLAQARKVFDEMHQRTIVSWTAMIAGYGTHGHGDEALFLFDKMLEEGIKPDEVVMVSVLPFKIPGECAVKESLESLFPDEVQPIVAACQGKFGDYQW